MQVRLYVLPESHPCMAVRAALELKGIEHRRVDLLPGVHAVVGPVIYGRRTVPGLSLSGVPAGRERIAGSREIMRRLDELAPEPALLPPRGDPRRAQVLAAEAWGDEVLQPLARRVTDAALVRRPSALESYAEGSRLPLPIPVLRRAMPLTARLLALISRTTDEAVQADLQALPDHLDRIDAWAASGLLGGPLPTAADLQIGASVRLLGSLGDVAPLLRGRLCSGLTRYFPPIVGSVAAGTLPTGWLPPASAEPVSATKEPINSARRSG